MFFVVDQTKRERKKIKDIKDLNSIISPCDQFIFTEYYTKQLQNAHYLQMKMEYLPKHTQP